MGRGNGHCINPAPLCGAGFFLKGWARKPGIRANRSGAISSV